MIATTRRPLVYLVAGGVNTVFGYFCGVVLVSLLSPSWPTLAIVLLSAVASISFSFVNYKLVVFKTRGGWLREYLRSYAVYGTSIAVSAVVLWGLIDGVHMSIWFAQGLISAIVVAASYFAHARYTFAAPAAPQTRRE